jgi:hypothetical protein
MATAAKFYCNNCKAPAERRTDLDTFWRCPACVALGAPGYHEVRKRGLEHGGPNYYNHALPHLRVVDTDSGEVTTGDAWAARRASSPSKPTPHQGPKAPSGKPGRAKATPSPLKQWVRDVTAARTLSDRAKLLARVVADHADWATGANAWPDQRTLAAMLGWERRQVRRVLVEVAAWIVVRSRRRAGGKYTSHEYLLGWPDGRQLVPSAAATPAGVAQPVGVDVGPPPTTDEDWSHE